jgi:hypothetical protein
MMQQTVDALKERLKRGQSNIRNNWAHSTEEFKEALASLESRNALFAGFLKLFNRARDFTHLSLNDAIPHSVVPQQAYAHFDSQTEKPSEFKDSSSSTQSSHGDARSVSVAPLDLPRESRKRRRSAKSSNKKA